MRVAGALVLIAAFVATPCFAQEELLTLRFGSAMNWEQNVFRVPDEVSDPQSARGVSGRSDRITTSHVGVAFNKAYSQQRFLVDITEVATRYQKFSYLDRNTYSYRGEWQWHLTPRVSGSMSVDRTESPTPFDEALNLEPNLVKTTNRRFNAVASLSGAWQLTGGLTSTERRNSQPVVSTPDDETIGAEAGIRYATPARSSIGYLRRKQAGNITASSVGQVAFGTGDFEVEENEVSAVWAATGRSSVSGRLTQTERRREGASQRNFSGHGGEIQHSWSPTGRLSVTTSGTRTVSPFERRLDSSYRVDSTFAVAPGLQVTEKIRLAGRWSRQTTDFRGPLVPVAGPLRRDVLQSESLSLEWTPHRRVILTGTLRHDARKSNEPGFQYEGTAVGVSAAFSL
jgi:exopolysaccharide biosynthesis operon protein EpsL